jgi:hypothetical protein
VYYLGPSDFRFFFLTWKDNSNKLHARIRGAGLLVVYLADTRQHSALPIRESVSANAVYISPTTFQVWSRQPWRGSANDGRSSALSLARPIWATPTCDPDLKASEFSWLTAPTLASDPLREGLPPGYNSGKDSKQATSNCNFREYGGGAS